MPSTKKKSVKKTAVNKQKQMIKITVNANSNNKRRTIVRRDPIVPYQQPRIFYPQPASNVIVKSSELPERLLSLLEKQHRDITKMTKEPVIEKPVHEPVELKTETREIGINTNNTVFNSRIEKPEIKEELIKPEKESSVIPPTTIGIFDERGTPKPLQPSRRELLIRESHQPQAKEISTQTKKGISLSTQTYPKKVRDVLQSMKGKRTKVDDIDNLTYDQAGSILYAKGVVKVTDQFGKDNTQVRKDVLKSLMSKKNKTD